jgi:hypothetical protein
MVSDAELAESPALKRRKTGKLVPRIVTERHCCGSKTVHAC